MTNLIQCFGTPETRTLVEGHDGRAFGLFDSKGREIGARSSISFEKLVPYVEGLHMWSTYRPALESYCLDVQATRGGKDYGPSFNRTHHLTLADAQKAKEAYFKSAAKRAQKTATK
mgnify:CR=1 FL=1